MKRFVRLMLLVTVAIGVAGVTQAWAQKKKDEEKLRIYVFAEKRGYDVTCSKLTTMNEINQRAEALDRENVGIRQGNTALTKEITDLQKKLPPLKAKVSKSSKLEQTEKDEAQTEIDRIEADIKSKQARIKPLVMYSHSNGFSKAADADAYIAKVQAEAAAQKAAAERAKAAKDKAAEKGK